MNRQNSPIIGYSSLSESQCLVNQHSDPIQVLQRKLEKLEEKYLNFVDRCSSLVKTENISKEDYSFNSEYSSSSPDTVNSVLQHSRHLMNLLKQLEKGVFLKELMSKIKAIVQESHNSIINQVAFAEKIKNKIRESQKSLLAEIWQNLFVYDNYIQKAAKESIKIIQKFEKLFLSDLKSGEKQSDLRNKLFAKSREDNFRINQKIRDISEPIKESQGRTSLQSLGARSLVSSPSSIRDIQGELKPGGLRALQSALGNRHSPNNEKNEIQKQLKNLQQKLQGFEIVAKKLINKSLKTEKTKRKNTKESDELNPGTFTLIERDVLLKKIEALELEKQSLEASLKTEKSKTTKVFLEKSCKEKDIQNITEDLERTKAWLKEANSKIDDLKKEAKQREETENILREKLISWAEEREKYEKTVNGLNESKKLLSDTIKEKDSAIDGLQAEVHSNKINYSAAIEKIKALKVKIRSLKEQKLSLIISPFLPAESSENLSENDLAETLKKSRENEKNLIESIEKYQEQCEILKKNMAEAKNKEKMLIEELMEAQRLNEDLSIEAEEEREKREIFELKFSKQRRSAELIESEKYSQLIKLISLENSLKNKEEALAKSQEELVKLFMDSEKVENQNRSLAQRVLELEERDKENLREIEKGVWRNEEIGRVRDELGAANRKLLEFERKNSDLLSSLELSKQQVKDFEENIKIKENLLQSLEISIRSKDSSLQSSQSSVKIIESKFKTLEDSYRSLEASHKSLECSALRDQVIINDLTSSLRSLENKNRKNLENEAALKSEISSLKDLLLSAESVFSEVQVLKSTLEQQKSLLLEMESLKSSQVALKSQLSMKDILIEQQSQSLSELQMQNANLELSINALNSELKSSRLQIEDLQKHAKSSDLDEQKLSLTQDLQNSQNTINGLQKEILNLNNSISAALKSENTLKKKVENLTSENENLLVALSSRSDLLTSYKAKIIKIQSTLNLVKKDYSKSLKKILKNTQKFKDFTSNPSHLKNFEELFFEFQRKSQELASQNSELFQTNQNLSSKCDFLSKALSKNKEELDLLMKKNSELQTNLKELTSNQDILQGSIQSLTCSNEFQENKAESALKENKNLSSLLESLKKDLEFSNLQILKDQKIYSSKLDEKISQIVQLTERNNSLSQSVSSMSFRISQLEQSLSGFEDLKEREKISRFELLKAEKENKDLRKKIEEKSKELEKVNLNIGKLQQDLDKGLRDFKNISAENKRLTEIQVAFVAEIKVAKDQVSQKLAVISELEKVILEKDKASQDLNNILSSLQNELEIAKENQRVFCENCLGKKFSKFGEDRSCPVPVISKTVSINPDSENRKPEDPNCVPVKKVKHGSKFWTLSVNEGGLFTWKETNSEIEVDEDLDEIKIALGDYYTGSILQAICELKKKADGGDYSLHLEDNKFDLISQSFRGEFLEAGLDISKIDLKPEPDIDSLVQELSKKNLEISEFKKKAEKKKRTLLLHKEQIVVLKEQIRKSQERLKELEEQSIINLPYLKQVFCGLIAKVKADKDYEDSVGIMFKLLGLSIEEVVKVQSQRKGGKKLLSKII